MSDAKPFPVLHVYDRGIGCEIHGPDGAAINDGHRDTFSPEHAAEIVRRCNAFDELMAVLQRLHDDIRYLEKSFGPSLYTTGAGYTLQPRFLEVKAILEKAGVK